MPAIQKRVSVATDCSGMETPVMALNNLGVPVNHVFSCDVNPHAKRTIMANYPPKVFFDDLTKRDNTVAPKADLYVAGFPCQPFSMAGQQQGFDDKRGRGTIFFHIRDYIEKQSPRVFLLENVTGLERINGGDYFSAIMESLRSLGVYNVHAGTMNTKEHGLPQNRPRIYFVGIKRSFDDGSFAFPEPLAESLRPGVSVFLDRRRGRPSEHDLPPMSAGTANRNVRKMIEDMRAKGVDPLKVPFLVDIDSSTDRMKSMLDLMPCMTCSRSKGHWISNRGRRVNKTEMMRIQGINPATFKVDVTEPQLGKQIGNAMSVNVLERLLVRILPAAKLAPHGALRDRWAKGKPPAELTASGALKRRAASAGTAARKKARVARA